MEAKQTKKIEKNVDEKKVDGEEENNINGEKRRGRI